MIIKYKDLALIIITNHLHKIKTNKNKVFPKNVIVKSIGHMCGRKHS